MIGGRAEPSFVELYTPKLISTLKERYGVADLRADAIAGLTVAIVALPLSMAIAIASGVTPDRGLYTAIVGGFFVSALGGSRFQIGGPAGAFIVLVSATVQQYGVDGLILATFLSGFLLLAIGLLRLGAFIKYIPYPVTVGFTSGIAVIIFASQIKELLGLTLAGPEPGPIIPKIRSLAEALPSVNPSACAIAVAAIAIILTMRRFRPHWPGFLIAVGGCAALAWLFGLPIETIGTRFGGIPHSLPAPSLPKFSIEKAMQVLPAALSFTLLGGIESLLVGRRRRQHDRAAPSLQRRTRRAGSGQYRLRFVRRLLRDRNDCANRDECARRRARSGRWHACTRRSCSLSCSSAAPLASYIPLAALGGVLAVVAWNMAEQARIRDAAARLARRRRRAARDISPGRVPRSDRRHPDWIRPWRASVPAPHGAGDRSRATLADQRPRQGRHGERRRPGA